MLRARIRSCRDRPPPLDDVDDEEVVVRSIGMDVHRDFCEVAIAEGGAVRAAGRITSDPEALELFAQSLVATE